MYCCIQLKFEAFLSPQRETLYPSVTPYSVLLLTTYNEAFLFFSTPDPVYWTAHVNGLIPCLCGLSLPAGSCPALWLNETPCKDGSVGCLTLYSCHILFPWPSAYESIPYFHLLIMSNVAVNIHGHIFAWTNVFTSLGHICWGQILNWSRLVSSSLCSGG